MKATLLSVRRRASASGALACAAALVALAAAACGQVRAPSLAPGGSGDRGVLARGHLRLISGNGMPVAANLRPAARERAIAQVERILARAAVPPGSHLVARLSQLSSPGNEIACNALEDDTLEWIVPPTAGSLSTFLASHVPAGMRSDASGATSAGGSVTSWLNEGARRSSASSPELIFTWLPVGGGTGLRADALAIPAGAACMSGGPEVSATASQHH